MKRKIRLNFHEVELILQLEEKKKKKKKTRKKRKNTGRMSFQLEPSASLISYLIRNTVEALVSGPPREEIKGSVIDLFTDTAAILNLFNLRGIMGCPGGHSLSIYARFWGKKRTSLFISREKGDHYYIQTRRNDLFSHYNLFLRKLKEKLARKARVNAERVYQIVLMPPWASHNTP